MKICTQHNIYFVKYIFCKNVKSLGSLKTRSKNLLTVGIYFNIIILLNFSTLFCNLFYF